MILKDIVDQSGTKFVFKRDSEMANIPRYMIIHPSFHFNNNYAMVNLHNGNLTTIHADADLLNDEITLFSIRIIG